MKSINCESCNQPMKLVKKGRTTRTKNKSRIRRFHCDLCDISHTVYADGQRDLIYDPIEAARKAGNINSIKDEERLEKFLLKTINYK